MANNIDKEFKQLIRSVKPDEPPLGFTAFVLNEIQAEIQDKVVVNPELKSLLQRTIIENPMSDFTDSTMNRIKADSHNVFSKPIISKKAWIIIAGAITFFAVILSFVSQTSDQEPTLTPFFGNTFNTIFKHITAIPSLYILTLISVSILLLMDYFMRTRFSGTVKQSTT